MITFLNLRNFRAFRAQSFEFSKINIFVGPNNSGKSSALSAINLLSQTVNNADLSYNPLVINGQFDNLGTFLDLVHGNRSNTPFGIDFGFLNYNVRLDYKYRQQRRETDLVRFELSDRLRSIVSYSAHKDTFTLKLQNRDAESIIPNYRKRRPQFFNLMPFLRLSSAILSDKGVLQIGSKEREFVFDAERQLSRARNTLREIFDHFDSISPFRDKPERTYLYSGESAQKIGTTGSNMATMLANDTSRRGSESRNITSEISRWFRVAGIAAELKLKTLTPRHFEIALADINGNDHNICDVGFGCSQVLPVLIAALNMFGRPESLLRRQAMLVVQEPEIHLHPNAQAALGSFFTGLLRGGGQLFLETHSDNLVLRIARHVAEGDLNSDDVKIFYVHKVDGASMVEKIGITENGRFQPEWPGGFFPQRQSESLSLARASSGNRKSGDARQLEFSYPEER